MTEIEQKALKLLNEVNADRGEGRCSDIWRLFPSHEALCRAIEQHEAFKQEVSDAVEEYYSRPYDFPAISQSFIIPKPKPDPLVEAIEKCAAQMHLTSEDAANALRAALDARGLEIREKDA